jgi:hypothetical protein
VSRLFPSPGAPTGTHRGAHHSPTGLARRVLLRSALPCLALLPGRGQAHAPAAGPVFYGPVNAGQALLLLVRESIAAPATTSAWTLHLCEAGAPLLDDARLCWGSRSGPDAAAGTEFDLRDAPYVARPEPATTAPSHVWLRLRWLDGQETSRGWHLATARPLLAPRNPLSPN